MPWKRMEVRHQRVEFVVRALRKAEPLAELCRELGISRPTGYLLLAGYREGGVEAIEEHSRRPRRLPTQTAQELEARIGTLRRIYPDWGARKLSVLLARQHIELPLQHTLRARAAQRALADGLQGPEELAENVDGPVGDRRPKPLPGGA